MYLVLPQTRQYNVRIFNIVYSLTVEAAEKTNIVSVREDSDYRTAHIVILLASRLQSLLESQKLHI